MNRTVLVIVLATAFVLVGSMFTRLALAHSDASGLTNYVTDILPLLVPAVGAWWNSHKAKESAGEAATNSSEAAVNSSEAATTANVVAENTNGKLDVKFAEVKGLITEVQHTMMRHLEMHAQQDGSK